MTNMAGGNLVLQSIHRLRQRFGWSYIRLFFVWAFLLNTALVARAVPPPVAFTIESIQADAAENKVRITFTKPITIKVLRENLRLFPYADIWWYRSEQLSPTTVELVGHFRYGQRYMITFPDDFWNDGYPYQKTIDTFIMPDRPSKIAFAEPGSVIERDSRQLLHLQVLNCNHILFQGIQVPPLLLPMALAATDQPQQYPWSEASQQLRKSFARIEETVGKESPFKAFLKPYHEDTELFYADPEKNREKPYSIPLGFRSNSRQGAFELIRIIAPDNEQSTSSLLRLFRITDIGITTQITANSLLAWITSLRTGKPLPGVSIVGLTEKMEFFYLGKTNKDGVILLSQSEARSNQARVLTEELQRTLVFGKNGRLTWAQRPLRLSRIRYILAASSNDVSYIEINRKKGLEVENVHPKIGRWQDQDLLRASVFAERGIYRPGDTVHFKGVVRRYKNGEILPPTGKFTFRIVNSRDEEVFALTKELSPFGSAWGDMDIKTFYPLGQYTLTISRENAHKPLASHTFQVQEFRPPRHFVRIHCQQVSRVSKEYINLDRREQRVRVTISGSYYAGGPVKHGQVRWKIFHTDAKHRVPQQQSFTFGYPLGGETVLLETGEAILDEHGETVVEFPLDRDVVSGKRGLLISAAVVDFDGRVASARADFQTQPELLVGIKRHPKQIQAETRQKLEVVIVDPKGDKVQKGSLQAIVMRRSGTYLRMRNAEGNLIWRYQQVWRKQYASDITLHQGIALFEFEFAVGGRYLISFSYRDEKGRTFSSATLYDVVGDRFWAAYENQNKPFEQLYLAADRPSYRPGETATVTVTAQRPITSALLVLEQGDIIEYQILEPETFNKIIQLPISVQFIPNVYASVIALSSRGDFPLYSRSYDAEAPSYQFGILNIPVLKKPEHLTIQIGSSQEELGAEPGKQTTLNIDVTDEHKQGVVAELAIAVINEAVLAVTDFQTPSLEGLRRFDGPLGALTQELRSLLIQQTPFHALHVETVTGGGGSEKVGPELEIRRDFKPVAYFNPAIVTDSSGHAQVSFTLPDTLTTYRVYVVACDRGSRFGNQQRTFTATKSFYLEPGLPRFFVVGDRFRFPVMAFNTTDHGGDLIFTVSTGSPLKLKAKEQSASLGPHASKKLWVEGEAIHPGVADLLLQARFGNLQDNVRITVPVGAGVVFKTVVHQGLLQQSTTIPVLSQRQARLLRKNKDSQEYVSGSLQISTNPFVLLSGPLHYLLEYPYGCVEQTSSGIIALAALRNIVLRQWVPGITIQNADRFLKAGIQRLLTMQTEPGGFAYWPGYHSADRWGTLYGTAALVLAQKSGVEIASENLQRALAYLKKTGENQEKSLLYRSFSAYVQALAGTMDSSTLQALILEAQSAERLPNLLLLLAAYETHTVSDNTLRSTCRPWLQGLAKTDDQPIFNAEYLEPALGVLLASRIFPGEPIAREAKDILLRGLGPNGIWTSTSDTGWALYALSAYYRNLAERHEGQTVTIEQDQAPKRQARVTAGRVQEIKLDPLFLIEKPSVRILSHGKQPLYYHVTMRFPMLDSERGGTRNPFRMWKRITNVNGTKTIRVGDIVRVTVGFEIRSESKHYLILDDPLPAGLVAINSALKTEEPLGGNYAQEEYRAEFWTPDGYYRLQPNYFEIRDQKVVVFRKQIWPGAYQFSYYARAVCEGSFQLPPTKMELMYEPEINGFTERTQVRIMSARR